MFCDGCVLLGVGCCTFLFVFVCVVLCVVFLFVAMCRLSFVVCWSLCVVCWLICACFPVDYFWWCFVGIVFAFLTVGCCLFLCCVLCFVVRLLSVGCCVLCVV